MYLTSSEGQAAVSCPSLTNNNSTHRRRDYQYPQLTSRETEVLQGIGLGFSIRELADQYCLSTHTIISHRNSLKEKLRCKKATQLAVMAERLGLLSGLSFHF